MLSNAIMRSKPFQHLRKSLSRSRRITTLVNLPSILQGINRASTWRDFALKNSAESNGPQTNFQTDVNPLEEYFDSVTEGRGIWKWTHYFDIYHRHFQKF